MKKSKFPTTEKQVIEFEEKNKANYKSPTKWTDVDEIINKEQLNLHVVSKSFYCECELIKSKKCNEQCSPCWYKSK